MQGKDALLLVLWVAAGGFAHSFAVIFGDWAMWAVELANMELRPLGDPKAVPGPNCVRFLSPLAGCTCWATPRATNPAR